MAFGPVQWLSDYLGYWAWLLGMAQAIRHADYRMQDDSSSRKIMSCIRQNYLTDGQESPSQQFPTMMLLVGLLEVVLAKFETNKTRREHLLSEVCSRIPGIPGINQLLDELRPLRRTYIECLLKTIRDAQYSLDGSQLANVTNSVLQAPCKPWIADFLFTSRYQENFEEFELIGRGGFGLVYRARNKVDQAFYAIKKICLRNVSHDRKMKILREARLLASMKHENIACYHTAWLEYVPNLPSSANISSAATRSTKSISPLAAKTSSSGGIVFVAENGHGDVPESAPNPKSLHRKDTARVDEMSSLKILEGGSFWKSNNHTQSGTNSSSSSSSGLSAATPVTVKVLSESVESSGSSIVFQSSERDENDRSYSSSRQNRSSNTVRASFSRSHSCPNGMSKRDKIALQSLRPRVAISNAFQNEFQTNGCFALFIQMQLYELNLKSWVRKRNMENPHNPWPSINHCHNLHIMTQILRAVEFIHSRNVVHRDLKLQNIFINSETRHIWVGDFGLARELETCQADPSVKDDVVLADDLSSGVGSQPYVAPEIQTGQRYDCKVDMYSCGVMLFELYRPFTTEMERSKVISALKATHSVQDVFITENWPALASVICSLLSTDPSRRPSAKQLLGAGMFSERGTYIAELEETIKKQAAQIDSLRLENLSLRKSNVKLKDANRCQTRRLNSFTHSSHRLTFPAVKTKISISRKLSNPVVPRAHSSKASGDTFSGKKKMKVNSTDINN